MGGAFATAFAERTSHAVSFRGSHAGSSSAVAKRYGSFRSAWRTLQGIEAVNVIRKGRVRWLAKADAVGQALFIGALSGLAV